VAKVDGALYGSKALTLGVIAFLVLVLPYVTAGAINVAYNYGERTTMVFPDSHTNYSHGVTWHTLENGSLNPVIPTPTTWSRDCYAYDHLTSTVGQFPAAPYQLNASRYGIVHNVGLSNAYVENITFRNIGSPFIQQANHNAAVASQTCSTKNDTIGFRLDPASALLEGGLGKVLIRFNTTILIPDWTVLSYLNIDEAEYDWRVEINGVEMFGEQVRKGDVDAKIDGIQFWPYVGASLSISPTPYPEHLRLDHTLNPTEERLVRNTLSAANISNTNLSIFITCRDSEQGSTTVEPCAFHEDFTSSGGLSGEWYINTQTEWIYADDYDLIIHGTAFILSIVSLLIAVASTPLWNPLASRLGGR
jgi:hypothetical protein